ncbi:MAG: hypothetical protein Q4A37_02250 [Candidatus Saccharibacteria bacterium]|nr:hypothetical protein [Candidatus Saccharibacteria bacterium]
MYPNNFETPYASHEAANNRDPQAVAELNDAYNSRLYGHIGENHPIENPSLSNTNELGPDQSDKLFTEAAMIAAENNRDLRQDKNHDNGAMTIRASFGGQDVIVHRTTDEYRDNHPGVPLTIIDFAPETTTDTNGNPAIIQKQMLETSPGRWDVVTKVISGDESTLLPEQRSGQREMTAQEVSDKDSILNRSSIDPEKQKDLSSNTAPHHNAAPQSEAVQQLTQEAYRLAA